MIRPRERLPAGLKAILLEATKSQLQGYYLHWFPGKEVLSARERLSENLYQAMTDHLKVRERFDALPRAEQEFVRSLLVHAGHAATVEEARTTARGRPLESFEVEGVIHRLEECGFVIALAAAGVSTVFQLPAEIARALKRTVAVDVRRPLELLSHGGTAGAEPATEHLAALPGDLATMAREALAGHGGILTRSSAIAGGLLVPADGPCDPGGNGSGESCRDGSRRSSREGPQPDAGLDRPEWRQALEANRLGTTGVLSLKDYGIDLEEEGLILYQEVVLAASRTAARSGPVENDREVALGADLLIDIDRLLEVLRAEPLELTRDGTLHRKTEERLGALLVTARHPEFHAGTPVNGILDVCRRLRLVVEEGGRIGLDPVRRRVWTRKPFLAKAARVLEIYLAERRGSRWSFHQAALREILRDELLAAPAGSWLLARPLLSACVARYLLTLEERAVREEHQSLLARDFRNETAVASLPKLHHDLAYWAVHRLALLGAVEAGYRDGAFHALRLSALGRSLFAGDSPAGESPGEAAVLVTPDFEILIYPEAPAEISYTTSLFAEPLESEPVRRYRLTLASVRAGVARGLTRDEILGFLEGQARGVVPGNVLFSARAWADGVEVVRREKALLLRARTAEGADRLGAILAGRAIPHERLGELVVALRGHGERVLEEIGDLLREEGLFLE